MYDVTTDGQSQPQIEALPQQALAPFAEVRLVLEIVPWNGDSIDERTQRAPIRTITFGASNQGMITYLILEHDRRVDILDVQWIG